MKRNKASRRHPVHHCLAFLSKTWSFPWCETVRPSQVMVVSMASVVTVWFYLLLEEVSKCSKTVLSSGILLLFFCVYNFSIILANAAHLYVITIKRELLPHCLLRPHISQQRKCRGQRLCGFDPWFRKIPRGRKWKSTAVFLPGESCGQRSLEGCDHWGGTESDTAENAHMHVSASQLAR